MVRLRGHFDKSAIITLKTCGLKCPTKRDIQKRKEYLQSLADYYGVTVRAPASMFDSRANKPVGKPGEWIYAFPK